MNNDSYCEYLVLGGEHHREVYTGPRRSVLSINAKMQPMAKAYPSGMPADITIPITVDYPVTRYVGQDNQCYLIASNHPLERFDVELEIRQAQLSPTL